MGYVKPTTAAQMAEEVYSVHNKFDLITFLNDPLFSQQSSQKQVLTAEVGSRLINTRDSFGVCARGAGEHKDDLFLIFRGSTFANYGADWLTNARIGLATSATGSFVHAGFNTVFESMRGDLASFISRQKGVRTIHCIGHSLGGAIANLAADWAINTYTPKVRLYTFGAPRVGFASGGFANKITTALLPENINRAYHSNDPVPMIPIFPYVHAPTSGHACYMPYNGRSISFAAHRMPNYAKSVSCARTWDALVQPEPSAGSVEQWLESDSVENPNTSTFWDKLNGAMSYILGVIMKRASIGIIKGLTIADQLAMLLRKGIDKVAEISNWVLLLIRKMMRALGMKVVETVEDLTVQLLRLVFNRITQKIYSHVRQALNNI